MVCFLGKLFLSQAIYELIFHFQFIFLTYIKLFKSLSFITLLEFLNSFSITPQNQEIFFFCPVEQLIPHACLFLSKDFVV